MNTGSLTRARDFQRVAAEGRRARSDGVLVTIARSGDPGAPSRLGLAVGKGAGTAVTRNRIRRRLRAAWKASAPPPGYEVVMGGSPALAHTDFQELVNNVKHAVSRAVSTGNCR